MSRTLRSSDRFCGRRVFFFWRRRVLGVAGGGCLRRFGVVLVRERVGGELRGGHRRKQRLPRIDQQLRGSLRACCGTRRGRMERSTAVFWGAGACGCFFAETRSVCSRVLSAVWLGPVRMRRQRFCVLTDAAGQIPNHGFCRRPDELSRFFWRKQASQLCLRMSATEKTQWPSG